MRVLLAESDKSTYICRNEKAIRYDVQGRNIPTEIYDRLNCRVCYYDVLHTLSFEEAIRDISIICFRNGGKLQYQDL